MDRFVVGTGRCGSTLLSRMLACNSDLLSLFEFFNGLDMQRRFSEHLTGEGLADLISAQQPFVTAVIRRGYQVAEVTYPYDRPGARYGTDDPLPWILVATLPALFEDPDPVFDEVMTWAREQPERPAADQYRALFGWLAARTGASDWVERSGSSIAYLDELAAQFPDARFVHLHRNGPEVALSMRRHHTYRLAVAMNYDVPVEAGVRASQLGPPDLFSPPTDDDAVSRILRSRPSAEHFGRYWSDQVLAGLQVMESIPPERIHAVRFEDLVASPAVVLEGIARFFELAPGDWVERGAALVRRLPPRRHPELPAGEARALEDACSAATERLAAMAGTA